MAYNRGSEAVYIDGVFNGVYSSYAPEIRRQLARTWDNLSPAITPSKCASTAAATRILMLLPLVLRPSTLVRTITHIPKCATSAIGQIQPIPTAPITIPSRLPTRAAPAFALPLPGMRLPTFIAHIQTVVRLRLRLTAATRAILTNIPVICDARLVRPFLGWGQVYMC